MGLMRARVVVLPMRKAGSTQTSSQPPPPPLPRQQAPPCVPPRPRTSLFKAPFIDAASSPALAAPQARNRTHALSNPLPPTLLPTPPTMSQSHTTMEAPGEEIKIPSASQFLAAFYPAIGTAFVCLVAFPLLRLHFPDVYDAKRERVRLGGSSHQRGDLTGMPPELPKFTLDWLKLLWSFNDEDILRFVGADALMFLRYFRVCFKAACLMLVYGLCVLVPINSIGANGQSEFEKFSASNVANGSQFLWAHFAGAYLFSSLLMYLLFKEYQKYVELRQQFMKSPTVQSYSIVIRDIPKDVDRDTVERYLGGLLGNKSVAIHLVENAKPYDALIGEKDAALFGLESARAKLAKGGGQGAVRPTHKLGFLGLWGEKVDSLDYYEKELEGVNEKIVALKGKERGFAHAAIVTFETIRVATTFQNIPIRIE